MVWGWGGCLQCCLGKFFFLKKRARKDRREAFFFANQTCREHQGENPRHFDKVFFIIKKTIFDFKNKMGKEMRQKRKPSLKFHAKSQ